MAESVSRPGWGIAGDEKLHVALIKAAVQLGALGIIFYGIYCVNERVEQYLNMEAASDTRQEAIIGHEINLLRKAIERAGDSP